MENEFSQASERDARLLQEKRERFNWGIQTLADLLEERRREADGVNIDTGKLDTLTKQIESFIAQLNGNRGETSTTGQREPSPFDDDYKEKIAAAVMASKPITEETANPVRTDQTKQEVSSRNPFA